jgi:hypothetical protein
MRFRKLRIAWSVFWGLACALLIGLCVRSYWRMDVGGSEGGGFVSIRGTAFCCIHSGPQLFQRLPRQFYIDGAPAAYYPDEQPEFSRWQGIGISELRGTVSIEMQYWFLVLASAAIAAAPWLRWRFSLRTLLIATTLVAVVLGFVIFASSH